MQMDKDIVGTAGRLESSGDWGKAISILKGGLGCLCGTDKGNGLLMLGKLYKYQGRFTQAIEELEKAEVVFLDQQATSKAKECILQQAIALQYLGHYDEVENVFHDLIEYADASSDEYILSHCYMQLGILHRIQARFSTSLKELNKCRVLKKRNQWPRDLAATIEQMGIVYERLQNYSKAEALYKQSYELKKQIGYVRGIGTSYLRMGVLFATLGGYSRARRLLSKSLGTRLEIGDRIGIGSSLYELSKIEMRAGNYAYSEFLARESLRVRKKIQDKRRLANTYFLLATVLFRNKKRKECNRYIRLAQEIRQELNQPLELLETLVTRRRFSLDSESRLAEIEKEIEALYAGLTKEQRTHFKLGATSDLCGHK